LGEAEDLVARGLLNQDELDWKVWHAEELSTQFAKLRPDRVQTQVRITIWAGAEL
jgi:hypothetical protein